MTSKPGFTNVPVQKFASEGELALFEWNWSEHRELVLSKLDKKGLFGFTAHQVWNQDENLTRMYIFEYECPEDVKAYFPVWKELETAIFGGIAMKLSAYSGVTVEAWKRD